MKWDAAPAASCLGGERGTAGQPLWRALWRVLEKLSVKLPRDLHARFWGSEGGLISGTMSGRITHSSQQGAAAPAPFRGNEQMRSVPLRGQDWATKREDTS